VTKIYSSHTLEQAIAHNLLIVSADASLHDVAQLINAKINAEINAEINTKSSERNVLCVLVVAESQLVGILTQSDLIRLMVRDLDIKETKVYSVMTRPVVTLRLEEFQDVITPLNLLRQHHLTYLPILDEHNYPIGLVTLEGLLQIADFTVRSPQHDQTSKIEYESLLTAIANRIQSSLDLQTILDTTVQEIRQFLQTDRVIAYRFEPDWSGIIVAESVLPKWSSLLGKTISDSHFQENMVEPYKNGRIQVTDNVYLGGLTGCHMDFLIEIEVKAIVVVPILNGDKLWGLLAAQECAQPRHWESSAIELLQQLATHIGIAIQQATTMTQLQQLNQELEVRISERTIELANSENHLNLIVSNVSDGILIVDHEGMIIFANPSVGKIFGMQTDELMGLRIGVPNELSDQFEMSLLLKDNRIGKSDVQVVLIEWDSQPAYLISLHDITEREQAEAQLLQTNEQLARATRMKDEFLANMSHELRTPLNAILGMTEALQEQILGSINEKQLKALQTVERSGDHLLSLINDILDVAKIESGQIELDCASINVASLCQSSLAFIKQQALKKSIQLAIKLPRNLPDQVLDERRIRQVLINLLNNAVKFTLEGGQITLEVTKQEAQKSSHTNDWLRFAITDTGIGIAPENINKLFQPFIQIDSALNRQYSGTGLGLALVKQIVELHGGKVGLTSELGVGSCFMIDLPYTPESPEMLMGKPLVTTSEFESPLTHQPTKVPLILIVEDNEINIITVSGYLQAKGYRLIVAKNGQEAIALTKAHLPDIILMDIQMPVMDGLEATQQIRLDPNLVNIPIIAMTALAMTGDRDRCIQAGATDYLSKPVKLKVLAQMIQTLLAPSRSGTH